MAKTTYLREKILKHVSGEASFTMPSSVYIGLLEEDPTKAGTQTSEVSGGSYARQEVTLVYDSDTESSKNDTAVEFTDMPVCTVRFWALFDASTAGNMLIFEPVRGELVVSSGQELTLEIGNLIYREV
jgi:hypothetical protein